MKGETNLGLFNTLFWVFLCTGVTYSYGVFPLSHQLRGGFPGNSTKGQICLRSNLQLGEMNLKQRIAEFAGQIVMGFLRYRFMAMVTRYVEGQNLNMRTFAQFGGTRNRNIFTIRQTNSYLLVCTFLIHLDNALITFFQIFKSKLDNNSRFIIHNLLWILSLNLFYGIYVPLKHIIQSRESLPSLWLTTKLIKSKKFYVRKPLITPRRSDSRLEFFRETHTGSFMYLTKYSLENNRHLTIHTLDQNYSYNDKCNMGHLSV